LLLSDGVHAGGRTVEANNLPNGIKVPDPNLVTAVLTTKSVTTLNSGLHQAPLSSRPSRRRPHL